MRRCRCHLKLKKIRFKLLCLLRESDKQMRISKNVSTLLFEPVKNFQVKYRADQRWAVNAGESFFSIIFSAIILASFHNFGSATLVLCNLNHAKISTGLP